MLVKDFIGKRILITGNTGFKGSWMSLFLKTLGAEVYGVSLKNTRNESTVNQYRIDEGCLTKQFSIDIRNFESLYECVTKVKPDYIFHLAAKAITLESFEAPLESIETNVMGTANLLEVVRTRNQACKLIVITSDKCYENKNWVWGYREIDTLAGSDPYSASKSMAEMVCRTYSKSFFETGSLVKIATCRAGNVIGGGDWSNYRIIPDCIRAWMKQETLSIRNPDAVRPWNYVLDTIWGYFLTAIALDKQEINGESFNFGPKLEDEITVLELVEGLWENRVDKTFKPFKIIKADSNDEKEHKILKLNSDKAYRVLGWKSVVNIREGLTQTSNWYLHYLKDPQDVGAYSKRLIEDFINKIQNK